jgi:hypothetical protein
MEGSCDVQRRRFKHIHTLPDRLANEARALKEKARLVPLGKDRDALLKKARQMEAAVQISDWLSSPGLRPPNSHHPRKGV